MTNTKIDALVDEWCELDPNPTTRREIRELQTLANYDVLDLKLSNRIAFGTAGLRSQMTSGFAHMNDVTVLQASQGLIQYILDESKPNPSIVVGYDHRHHSQRFAELVASVAISRGVKVYYLGEAHNLSRESIELSQKDFTATTSDHGYCHTPLVPFTIDHYKASAGVMVTASHNPAKDNGYKVYYGNGCQIIPPHDDGIAASIEKCLKPWANVWEVVGNFADGLNNGLLECVRDQMVDEYVKTTKDKLVVDSKLSFDFVYTPVHGIGHDILDRCVTNAFTGYNMAVVKEQKVPDPDFSTVPFPNPEEKGALDLAMSTADKLGLTLVIANDPDADRFSVAVRTRSGQWQQLTGNEIGFLFAMYVIEEVVPKADMHKTWLLNSTVSSQVLKSIAAKNGCHFQDTLTGFKWIGNKAIDLKNDGMRVPFAYEEAIGFMFNVVNDKDGVSAAMVWLQLYEKWFAHGLIDPIEKLAEGYSKYGWYKECNGYYKLDDLSKTKQIFTEVRGSFTGNYPETIGDFKVVDWRDLTVGFETGTADGTPVLPVDPKSQMITATLARATDNGTKVRFTCRGSGTEPKLKVYIEGTASTEELAVAVARDCWKTLKVEWFKPEQNGLKEVV